MPKLTRVTDQQDQKQSTRRRQERSPQASGPAPADGHWQRLPAHPSAASASDVTQLQARYGNRAVQRLLDSHSVRAKLQVGPAGDPYEQQADPVAQPVMRLPETTGKDEEEEKA